MTSTSSVYDTKLINYINIYRLDLNKNSLVSRGQLISIYKDINQSGIGFNKLISSLVQLGCTKETINRQVMYRGVKIVDDDNIVDNSIISSVSNAIESYTNQPLITDDIIKRGIEVLANEGLRIFQEQTKSFISNKFKSLVPRNRKQKDVKPFIAGDVSMIDNTIMSLMVLRNHIQSIPMDKQKNINHQLSELDLKIKINKDVFIKKNNKPRKNKFGISIIDCSHCGQTIYLKNAIAFSNDKCYSIKNTNLICSGCNNKHLL